MSVCPICGARNEDGLNYCMKCGVKLNQQQPTTTPSIYPNMRQTRTEFQKATPWLIITGTILIGIGIIILGMIPGDVYIDNDSFQSFSKDEFHPQIQINSLQIAAILIGIGTILEGLAVGLNVKASFDLKKQR